MAEDRDQAEAAGAEAPAAAAPENAAARMAAPLPRRRLRRRVRFSLWMLGSLMVLVLAAGFAALALTGKPIRLPVWMVAEAEAQLNARLPLKQAQLSLGGIEVMVDRAWVPRLRLESLVLARPDGATILRLPEARVAFDGGSLLRGALRPE